jgi:ubiquinone/menaquinone biosynthesis C-methylase UbiE
VGFHSRWLLPRILDVAMRNRDLSAERARIVPSASGTVLEVGIGSGLNLSFYGAAVARLYGLDPSVPLWRLARARVKAAAMPVRFVAGSAERIPLRDRTVDTAVLTWTLCSVADPIAALGELRRVLRPGGRLLFVEHGRAPEPAVAGWQDRLTPCWKRLAGGCHLNRRADELIRTAGFEITALETGYMRGPRPFAFLFRGAATAGPR